MRRSVRRWLGAGVALALTAAIGLPAHAVTGATTVTENDPVLVAAGDIACDPADPAFNRGKGTATRCRQAATAALAASAVPAVLAPLGDIQYDKASTLALLGSYDRSWGRLAAPTRPAVGNHEYGTAGALGYFTYFGTAAGAPLLGYYSYDLGSWHVVVLNSNCTVTSCAAGSAQERWLRADLKAHPTRCTLAYFHHPRFSSGEHGDNASVAPFWKALYDYQADVILAGHDHDYERFAKIRPDGTRDGTNGIRSWVVGTGGKSLYKFGPLDRNSVVHHGTGFGVLKLRLGRDGYRWKFLGEPGSTFADSGTGACRA